MSKWNCLVAFRKAINFWNKKGHVSLYFFCDLMLLKAS
jgi:hypothetical protein